MAGKGPLDLTVQTAQSGPVTETDTQDLDPRVERRVVCQQLGSLNGIPVVHKQLVVGAIE